MEDSIWSRLGNLVITDWKGGSEFPSPRRPRNEHPQRDDDGVDLQSEARHTVTVQCITDEFAGAAADAAEHPVEAQRVGGNAKPTFTASCAPLSPAPDEPPAASAAST